MRGISFDCVLAFGVVLALIVISVVWIAYDARM